MKKTILIGFIFIILLVNGCSITGKTISEGVVKEITCNPPYIEYKTGDCCLDQNDNKICDDDETSIESQQQEQKSQTYCGDETCQSDESCSSCPSDCGKCEIGKLAFVSNIGDNYGEFFDVCSGNEYPAWCKQTSIFKNEYDVYVNTLKDLPFKTVATFVYRIENQGKQKVEDIETTIICDEISTGEKKWAITDSATSHKGITLSKKYFNCATCEGNCACDKYPEGNKVIYIIGCDDGVPDLCEGGGWNIDRWLEFNVEELTSDVTLSCDIKVFSENPTQSIKTNLLINFLADR